MKRPEDRQRAETFRQWLEVQYIDWQRTQGGRRSMYHFARFLGVADSALSHWMHAIRTPNEESVALLALALGPEVYKILGLPTPDMRLVEMEHGWLHLPEASREKVYQLAKRLMVKSGRAAKHGDGREGSGGGDCDDASGQTGGGVASAQ